MELICETDRVYEYADGNNRSFFLKNDNAFSVTDYRVMCGQERSGLVRCEKVIYNGKIKLLYFTEGYKALEELAPYLNERNFMHLVSDFAGNLIQIKDNGFFECENLMMDIGHIMVDEKRMKMELLYLPIENIQHTTQYNTKSLDDQVRLVLTKMIQSNVVLSERIRNEFLLLMVDPGITLDRLYSEINNRWFGKIDDSKDNPHSQKKTAGNDGEPLTLVLTNSAENLNFRVCRKTFTIGRKSDIVDGVIKGYKTVGREHCRILYKDGQYYVKDLDSKNGTYVNEKRVQPDEEVLLVEGVKFRVAEVGFELKYVKE